MGWSISAEVIAFIIVFIISIYSRKSQAAPSTKNRMFKICLITTLGAIGSNLASTLLIAYADQELQVLTNLVTIFYFILTPLLGTAYYYYAVAVVSEARPVGRVFLFMSAIPSVLYTICAVLNVATGSLFFFDAAGNYQQGPWIASTYLIFYIYCIACFALVVLTRAPIDPVIKRILAVFPLVAVMVIAVQQVFPTYLLSGSAAACSLLIIYLYLQNKQLSIDSLTSLPNHQEFLSLIRIMHNKERPFTGILVSISNFKFINDKFGHTNGDLFLQNFSQFLSSLDPRANLYRYGGDEFAFIIDEAEHGKQASANTNKATAATILQAIQCRLQDAWDIADNSYSVTVAIGVVSYPSIANNLRDAVTALEYCATQSKKLESNTPYICTPEVINIIHRRARITNILRDAVKNKSFTVHYQPIWSEKAKQFLTAEALCRLSDPTLGNIPPDEFISIAEQTGLISDITNIVLDQTCAFMSEFRQAHPGSNFQSVSVNFSAVQFMQQDISESVLETIKSHNISPACICIEFTESAIFANPDAVNGFMNTMHQQGIRFYLDDFGTGYSNLASMLNLPFDVIKLDKSLLDSAASEKGKFQLLCKLVAGFEAVGRTVLAEGIETQQQSELLDQAGCGLKQGYLFSRPLPPEEATRVIVASEQEQ